MRAIDADKLYMAFVEMGQENRRGKYKIGENWELNGEEIRQVIDNAPTINPELIGKGTCENCQYASLFDGGLVFCVRKKCFERVKLDYSCKYWKEEKT